MNIHASKQHERQCCTYTEHYIYLVCECRAFVTNCRRGKSNSRQSASICKPDISVHGADQTWGFFTRRLRLHVDISWRLTVIKQLEFLHASNFSEPRPLRVVQCQEWRHQTRGDSDTHSTAITAEVIATESAKNHHFHCTCAGNILINLT